ncbi:MAG: ABC transporter permease [Lachnospiraceae bacterium]|nr:ABC transporter permease [Lachnospiraceae bacterium]
MIRYILKRILTIIPVVLLVAVVVFTVMYFSPGNPAEIILGPGASEENIHTLEVQLGLDQPYFVQLGRFMFNTFIRFDLGNSYVNDISISHELAMRFPKTLLLAVFAIVLELIVGIPLGMIAAIKRNRWQDQLCMLFALIGVSAPAFWLGIEMVLIFSNKLHLLPSSGISTWTGWILPVILVSLRGVAQMARQARSSMLEVIKSDYVTTGRAKGLKEGEIMFKYALPNALIPLIQTAGNSFASSLGGAIVIESLFSIPGIGQYMIQAIGGRDYAVIRGTVVVLSIAFCLIMLIVDLIFAFVDPRIMAQYSSRAKKERYRAGHGKEVRSNA